MKPLQDLIIIIFIQIINFMNIFSYLNIKNLHLKYNLKYHMIIILFMKTFKIS